jgi:hypothetical protein
MSISLRHSCCGPLSTFQTSYAGTISHNPLKDPTKLKNEVNMMKKVPTNHEMKGIRCRFHSFFTGFAMYILQVTKPWIAARELRHYSIF